MTTITIVTLEMVEQMEKMAEQMKGKMTFTKEDIKEYEDYIYNTIVEENPKKLQDVRIPEIAFEVYPIWVEANHRAFKTLGGVLSISRQKACYRYCKENNIPFYSFLDDGLP